MRAPRRRLRFSPRGVLIALGILVAVPAGAWYWHAAGTQRETDNAYVNARIVQVSSLVMGQVVSVPISENQYVHRGDVLFELDRRPFEAALAEAEGKLRQAEQGTRQDTSELLATRHVPETPVKARGMDWWGLVFLAMFIGGLQYVLDRGQQEDWFASTAIRVSAAVLVAGLAMFVMHAIHSKRETLFSLELFADRNFAAASIVGGAMGLSLFGGMLLQPVLLENLLQYPTFDTGVAMVPRGIGSLISMLIVGRLVGKVGAKPLIYFGIATGVLGAWMLTHVGFDASATTLIVPLILQGVGVGFVFVPLSAVAFATLPGALATEAAGVYSLIRSIGSSIGISIVSVSMTRGAQASWGALRGHVDPYRPELQQYLDPLHLKVHGAGLALIARETALQAQMLGLLRAFWVIVVSFLVMIPLVMLLKPGRAAHAPPVAME